MINLSGFGIGSDRDTDADGLNDAAEFLMSGLGFDWQRSQPDLVKALFDNARAAGLYTTTEYNASFREGRTAGRSDVTNKPSAYGLLTEAQYNRFGRQRFASGQSSVRTNPLTFSLFTQADYRANFAAGRSAVTSNPARFNLVSRTNIPPVRLAVPGNAAFTLNLGGTWTRYAIAGKPKTWAFNTSTGELKGLMKGTNERTLRLVPYNGRQAGPQMMIQVRPAP